MPGTQLEPRPEYLPVHVPGMPAPKRESEAAPARLLRAARRNKAVSVPLSVPLPVWTATEIVHAAGTVPGAMAAGGSVAGAAAVWLFASHKWDRPAEVWYARATAVLFAGWEAAAVFAGPVSAPAAGSLAAIVLAWGIPWYRHYRIRGRKGRQNLLGEWAHWWACNCGHWNLAGSRVVDAADDGVVVRLRIQLWGGKHTEDDVRAAVKRIGSALGKFAAGGGVRIQGADGDLSQVDVFFKRKNPLAEVVEWDEKAAPRSVLDAWHPGLTETGARRAMRQMISLFTLGAKGSGKSTLLLNRILSLCGCADGLSVLIDLKGGRSARPVLETQAADYVITEMAEAEMAYLMAEAEILARMEGAYDGHEQLTPSASTPAMFLHVDETHRLSSLTRGSAQAAASMEAVATMGRSAAVYEDVITQYGALDASVRSEATRMNLDGRFVFKMPRADMASFAINEYTQLDVSQLDGPGECYANDKGQTDPERLRVVNISHDAFREIAPARIAGRGPKPALKLWCGNQPCPAGGTWQQWWDSRWSRLPKAFREISPQYREWADEHGEPEEEAPSVFVSQSSRPAAASPPPEQEMPAAAAARIAAETEGPDAAPTAMAAARAAGTTARRREAFCDALAAAAGGISPQTLVDVSGMSRSWVQDSLRRLAERGAVTRAGDGIYVPAPGRSVHAELTAIREGDAALLTLVSSAS